MKSKDVCFLGMLSKLLVVFWLAIVSAANANLPVSAQETEMRITVEPQRRTVRVSGTLFKEVSTKRLQFEDSHADVYGIAARISKLVVHDENGTEISVKKTGVGTFEATRPIASFAYDINLQPLEIITSAAHVSWLTDERGLLMMNDLIPVYSPDAKRKIKLNLSVPNTWKISTNEESPSPKVFYIKDPTRAVFFVGRDLRESTARIHETELNLSIAGEWLFTDAEAREFASTIFAEHKKVFVRPHSNKIQIVIAPFPLKAGGDRWRAETRGSTILILSGSMPFRSQALQRLREQLRHEIFHLWIPNSLALTGNYSWFYEGFAIYQALRTGVELNQIRFEDFLSTLGRAIQISKSTRNNSSLIEASSLRWYSNSARIEARGIVAAFLCDVALLDANDGKRNLTDVFRTVFDRHNFAHANQEGNQAILKILKESKELREIVSSVIEFENGLNVEKYLSMAGLEFTGGRETKLLVTNKPKRREKALLRKLGYDNWKKLVK